MAMIVKAKLRFSSLSLNFLSHLSPTHNTYSSQSQSQPLPNDAAVLHNTTSHPPVSPEENNLLVQNLYSLIQQYHLQNPKPRQLVTNPNLKIKSLSLILSKSTPLFSSRPLPPSVVRRVIDKCGCVRKDAPFLEALAFFNWATSRRDYPRVPEPYNDMIDFAGKFREFSLVWDLIDLMRSRNVEVTDLTHFIVVRRYLRARLVAEAVDVFDRMQGYGCEPDGFPAFRAGVRFLCGKKKAVEAQWFFDKLKDRFEPDLGVYNDLLETWCRSGNLTEAERVVMDMKRIGLMPNVYTYSAMVYALCKCGQIVLARKVFSKIVKAGCKPQRATFNSLMFAHLNEKKYGMVLVLYDMMKSLKCFPDTITCNYVMAAQCKQNNLEGAIGLLYFMHRNGCNPNVRTYNILFGCIAKLERVKRAPQLYKRVTDLKSKPKVVVYDKLIPMFANSKSTDMVLELKKEMKEKNIVPDAVSYHHLLRVLCKKGEWENAYKFFREMIEESQLKPEGTTYEMVIKHLKEAEQSEKVEELAEKMVARGFIAVPSK